VTNCNQILIENILLNTNNLNEQNAEALALGLLHAFDNGCYDKMILDVFECIILHQNASSDYLFNHIKQILKICLHQRMDHETTKNMIQFGIGHPLIAPSKLFEIMNKQKGMADIEQLNLLSSLQLKYEQTQLFLGRYLLYCPFATKTITPNGKYDDCKADQDEVEFYDENDDGDGAGDTAAMLIEITIDIDDTDENSRRQEVTFKKCLCVRNNEIEHYYEDKIVHEWQVVNYKEKILRLNNTLCQWVPNLDHIAKISPSFSAIDANPDDLNNAMRGYLVMLPDDDGVLSFVRDLFAKWNQNILDNNKYTECLHRMQERPLFACMEKWKLIDVN